MHCKMGWWGVVLFNTIRIDKRIKVKKFRAYSQLFVCHVYGVILCILIINQKRHDIFQTKITQEAENLCRKREGCNINKFAIKVEKWVYIKDISKCVVS